MKSNMLLLSLSLAVLGGSSAWADDAASKDEIKSEFKVDDARVQGMRDQKMGYGEISIALALAEKRPGGITDANVAAVLAERQGPPKMGWGQIARKQGVAPGGLRAKLERVEKQEKSDKAERAEKAEKPERAEKAQRPERMEKSARPERASKR